MKDKISNLDTIPVRAGWFLVPKSAIRTSPRARVPPADLRGQVHVEVVVHVCAAAWSAPRVWKLLGRGFAGILAELVGTSPPLLGLNALRRG